MNVKELRELIRRLPDEMPVLNRNGGRVYKPLLARIVPAIPPTTDSDDWETVDYHEQCRRSDGLPPKSPRPILAIGERYRLVPSQEQWLNEPCGCRLKLVTTVTERADGGFDILPHLTLELACSGQHKIEGMADPRRCTKP